MSTLILGGLLWNMGDRGNHLDVSLHFITSLYWWMALVCIYWAHCRGRSHHVKSIFKSRDGNFLRSGRRRRRLLLIWFLSRLLIRNFLLHSTCTRSQYLCTLYLSGPAVPQGQSALWLGITGQSDSSIKPGSEVRTVTLVMYANLLGTNIL